MKHLSKYVMDATIGAINYYQYRHTALAMSFPDTLVSTFFKDDDYSPEAKTWLAELFGDSMHGKNGEKDWDGLPSDVSRPWMQLYNFCKGWRHGFAKLHLDGKPHVIKENEEPCKTKVVEVFKVEATGEWFGKDDYIKWSAYPKPIDAGRIIKIELPDI